MTALPTLLEHFHHSHGITGLGHLLHHLLGLLELIQQLVDIGWCGPAALGDPATATAVQYLRTLPFLTSHRPYDSLDPLDSTVVQVSGGHFFT